MHMCLLVKWEGQTGKNLNHGHDARTERSEIRASWPINIHSFTLTKGEHPKRQPRNSLRRPIYSITSVGETKLSCFTPHWLSTAVSLETYPFYS